MSSAISESGGGTAYEYLVVTYLWGLLAAEEPFRFGSGTVEYVACQRSHLMTGYDDVEVKTREHGREQRWLVQAKRTVKCRASDPTFREVIERAHRDAHDARHREAAFVVVAEVMSEAHREVAPALVELARASLSYDDLLLKLPSERGELRKVFDAICEIVGENDHERIFETLQALYFWHLPLEDEGNDTWRVWRHVLTPRANGQSRMAVDSLKKAFYSAAAKAGRDRRAHNYSTLRNAFRSITRPTPTDPSASPFAKEALEGYRKRVDVWEEERHIAAFETLGSVDEFLLRSETWFLSFGREGQSATDFAAIVAQAQAIKGSLLLNLGFSRELSEWTLKASQYAEHSDWLREMLARVALTLGDRPSFEEWRGRTADEDGRILLSALAFGEEKDYEQAVIAARLVKGHRKPVAISQIRNWRADQAHVASDPEEASRHAFDALAAAEEALSYCPDRVTFKMFAAEAALLTVSPALSRAYVGAKGVIPERVGERLSATARAFRDVIDEEGIYGVHERALAALCLTDTLNTLGYRAGLPSSALESTDPYLARTDPERQEQFGELMNQYGRTDLARQIYRRLQGDEYDEETRQRALKLEGMLDNPPLAPIALDDKSDIPAYIWGEACLRGALGALEAGELVRPEILEQLDEKATGTAWHPATCFVSSLVANEHERQRAKLYELLEGFPEAVEVFGMLSIALSDRYRSRLEEFYPPDGEDFDDGYTTRAPLTEVGEQWREATLGVLHHAGDVLGLYGALDQWVQTAANPLDRVELDRAASSCEKHGHEDGRHTASFLAEYARPRWGEAAKAFESAVLEGWKPSAGMRATYDRVRANLGRWHELAQEATLWLTREHRPPTAIGPGVQALVQVGRKAEAFELAKENAEAFPDSSDAAHLVVQTAHVIDRADHHVFLKDFSERHPNDSRAWKLIPIEEAVQLFNKPLPIATLWEKQSKGAFPIHMIEQRVALAYERALTGSGIVMWRPGIPLAAPEQFATEVMLDITAVLSIDHLGLWQALRRSGLRLCVHPSVYTGLRAERDSLSLEACSELAEAAARVNGLLQRLAREGEEPGATDEAEAERIGGVVANSWREGGRTLLGLIRSSAGRIPMRQIVRLEQSLTKVYESAQNDLSHEQASKIVLSAQDAKAVCHADAVDAVLDCFERVSISTEGRYWLSRFFGHAWSTREAYSRAEAAFAALESEVKAGQVRLLTVEEEPLLDSFRYVVEVGRIAGEEKLSVWIDDLALRRLLAQTAPTVVSCSTWDALTELRNREAHTPEEASAVAAEAIRSGFGSVPRLDAYSLLLGEHRGQQTAVRHASRVCFAMSPREDDPPAAHALEIMLAAHQLARLIYAGDESWRVIAERFFKDSPRATAFIFWEVVLLHLAGAEEDLWETVKELVLWGYRENVLDTSRLLVSLAQRRSEAFPAWFISNTGRMPLVQLEGRWRIFRMLMLRRGRESTLRRS